MFFTPWDHYTLSLSFSVEFIELWLDEEITFRAVYFKVPLSAYCLAGLSVFLLIIYSVIYWKEAAHLS